MEPDAEVRVPADSAYVAVIRMASAAIAARLDFTIEEIEDLRIAVGEACALLLPGADADGSLTVGYHLAPDGIGLTVSADSATPRTPDHDSFAWQVLCATAADVTTAAGDRRVTIGLTLRRDAESRPA